MKTYLTFGLLLLIHWKLLAQKALDEIAVDRDLELSSKTSRQKLREQYNTILEQIDSLDTVINSDQVAEGRKDRARSQQEELTEGLVSLSEQLSNQEALSKDMFMRLIREDFRTITTTGSNVNVGNYASLDTDESEITLATNIAFKNSSLLNVKITGGNNDNQLPIYGGGNLDSKIGMELQLNLLGQDNIAVYYDLKAKRKLDARLREIDKEYEVKKAEIDNDLKKNVFLGEIEKLKESIYKNQRKLNELMKSLGNPDLDEEKKSKLELDRKILEGTLSKQRTELKWKENEVQFLPSRAFQQFEIDDWRIEEYEKAQKELKSMGSKLDWLSVGYGIKNSKFSLFDADQPTADQVSDTSSLSHTFSLIYSSYHFSLFGSRYWNAGIKVGVGSNMSDLKSMTLVDRTYHSSDSSRFSDSSQTVLLGDDFETGVINFSLVADFYQFLDKKQELALHVFPFYGNKSGDKMISDLGIGVFYSFKDAEKEKSVVNAEIFYNLIDLFGVVEKDKPEADQQNLWQRSNLGIRFSFPFNYKPRQ